jgi:hypothetical protein
MSLTVLWAMTLSSLVDGYQRFEGTHHFHLQGENKIFFDMYIFNEIRGQIIYVSVQCHICTPYWVSVLNK